MIGVDIIDIERFARIASRTPRILERLFSPAELEYCFKKTNPYPSLAVRFAAKEAVRKLDKMFIQGVSFQDIEVVIDYDGKPGIALHGHAGKVFAESKWKTVALSLSHGQHQAVAVAMLQKGSGHENT